MVHAEVISVDAQCSEGLGPCGSDCDVRCRSRRGGNARGECNHTFNSPLCTCYYDCGGSPPLPSPPERKCTAGLGLCSVQSCDDACCNSKCAAKYRCRFLSKHRKHETLHLHLCLLVNLVYCIRLCKL
ncbi:hypothetical protein ACFX2B_012927 [Malus domestica]